MPRPRKHPLIPWGDTLEELIRQTPPDGGSTREHVTEANLCEFLGIAPNVLSDQKCGKRAIPKYQQLRMIAFFAQRIAGVDRSFLPADAGKWAQMIGHLLAEDELKKAYEGVYDERTLATLIEQVPNLRAVQVPPAQSHHPTLTTEQRETYLRAVTKAYQWDNIYVEQEVVELHDPPPAPSESTAPPEDWDVYLVPTRDSGSSGDHGDPPEDWEFHRDPTEHNLEWVHNIGGLPRREPIPPGTSLLDWFLEKGSLALLAVPGCGKTTALGEMAATLADAQLHCQKLEAGLPVLVSLGDYDGTAGTMEQWLATGLRQSMERGLKSWFQRLPRQSEAYILAEREVDRALPPLLEHLEALRRAGKLTLLFDGLNELPYGAGGPLGPEVRQFIRKSSDSPPAGFGNRVVVACRVADYHGSLTLLNRVELRPFDKPRMQKAFRNHLRMSQREDEADAILAELDKQANARLIEVLSIPLYVHMLSKSVQKNRDKSYSLPANRGQLLDGFVKARLDRELKIADRARRPSLNHADLLNALADMAYHFRHAGKSGSLKDAATMQSFLTKALRGKAGAPEVVLSLAEGAGLLSRDISRLYGKILFELVEELLAARHMLALFAGGEDENAECCSLWRVPLRRDDPQLADQRERGEPPSHPNTNGAWEQTTILAAGLAIGTGPRRPAGPFVDPPVSADDFVTAVLAVNPWLAGRCIHEGGAQVSDAVRAQVQQTLLDVLQDRDYSVRARVPCGVLLGELGDPRFHGKDLFYLPREELLGFIKVPAGPFIMGSDRETVDYWNGVAEEAINRSGWYNNESYGREQDLPYDYLIARYPVTNAQFRCFVEDKDKDGGYPEWEMDFKSQDWTPDGLKWVLGDRWSDVLDRVWRWDYQNKTEGVYKGWDNEDDFIENGVKPFLRRLRKDGPAAEYWSNPDYNPPNQPVTGVTWYEAVAYANWLQRKLLQAEQCPPELRRLLENGLRVRLPSEPEWEKAARGGLQIPGDDDRLVDNPQERRQWPWEGDWDPGRCNTDEGGERVRWLSPVGMYPDGASPYGCLDMIGNVWEWTCSRYEKFYPYPADKAGRRDREDPENIGSPVLRGGSWLNPQRNARCAVRNRSDPDNMDFDLGLRLVVSLSDSGS